MIKYQIVKDYGGICRKDLSVREECSTLKVHEHFTHAVIHTFNREEQPDCLAALLVIGRTVLG